MIDLRVFPSRVHLAQLAQLSNVEFGGDVSEELLRQEMVGDVEMSHEQFVESRSSSEAEFERLDKALHALGGGIARLERKLDRILALVAEARVRNR